MCTCTHGASRRRAEDQMAQAQAEFDAARRDLDRLSGLAERGSATEKSRDDAATRKEIAERAVAAARVLTTYREPFLHLRPEGQILTYTPRLLDAR